MTCWIDMPGSKVSFCSVSCPASIYEISSTSFISASKWRALGAENAVSLLPKIKIEVAVATDQVDKTIEAITSAAKTGQIGDGKIFVINLDHAVRIRTGEADAAAL